MGFTKTSEGRVFFKNADNDDPQHKTSGKTSSEPVMPSDNTQMQILLLLKSLNTKLKTSKTEQASFKSQLAQYKKTIKNLEEKATEQETNYIDLEQKVALKQSETSKKATRVENSVKNTLKQIEEAKKLVKVLEAKENERHNSLKSLKEELQEQKTKDEKFIKRQKSLEAQQKKQGEKMVDNVAAYVALTKRVSEGEAKHEELDNKIEDVNSEYLKLDRKIDKAIEDRNRILRKVDRIEQAVLETRDALNAKAMVLLTDQGAVAGVNMPQISDQTLQTDPTVLNRRLQEEAMMPWWRRPVRVQTTSLALIMIVVMILGWLLSEIRRPNPTVVSETASATVSLSSKGNVNPYRPDTRPSYEEANNSYAENFAPIIEEETVNNIYENTVTEDDFTETPESEYGITIHKGMSDPEEIAKIGNEAKVLDINNDAEMLAAMEENPERVATRLNQIEPSSLTTEDKAEPPPRVESTPLENNTPAPARTESTLPYKNPAYIADLKQRIKPDPNLTELPKKIEGQAFSGIPEAQHDMGTIYVTGYKKEGIEQNIDRAVLWFTEAANNGIPNAKYNLGVLYHQGMGVKQSLDKAMILYNEAAEMGHPEAQYNLGIANIEGIGVPYNPERAAKFFEQAADKGVTEAAYNLGLIYENGLLGSTRPDDALAWYKTAADQGSPEAKSALDQLAASLGIGINDVNKIVEKLQAEKQIQRYNNNNSTSGYDSFMTSQVQEELMRRGLYPGPIDGMLGPMTKNAIKTFQTSANMDVNGLPSQHLLNLLQASSDYR